MPIAQKVANDRGLISVYFRKFGTMNSKRRSFFLNYHRQLPIDLPISPRARTNRPSVAVIRLRNLPALLRKRSRALTSDQPFLSGSREERAGVLSGISIQCESRGGCGTARSRRTEAVAVARRAGQRCAAEGRQERVAREAIEKR